MIERARARRPLGLLEVVILTSPLVIALAVAASAALFDYLRARQFDDWWSRTVTLEDAFAGRMYAAVRAPAAMTVRQRLDATADDAIAIRIQVPSEEWDAQVANPFLDDAPWVGGSVLRAGGSQDADVRKRGDTSVHWTTPKTSFTLRTSRGERVRGFRELALTGKEVLASHTANSVPAEFGILAPYTALVPVYLNERFQGLYRAVEPIDESFLRRMRRMPGNIFRADAAERGEYYKGLPRNVFTNPYVWERVASSPETDEEAFAALVGFLDAANAPGIEGHLELLERIDPSEIARLLAAMLVVGDPYHMSGVHNQFWFEDPTTGILHPIPWDLRLLDLEAPATNPLNDLFGQAIRDPRIVDEALRSVHVAAEGGLLARMEDRLAGNAALFDAHLEYERLRRELISPPGEPARIRATLASNLETLARWAGEATVGFRATAADGVWILDFETRGFAGVDLAGLRVRGGDIAALRLVEDRDRDGVLSPGDRTVPTTAGAGVRLVASAPVALLPTWTHDGRSFAAGRGHYRLFLAGLPSAPGSLEITAMLRNRVTGEAVEPAPIAAGEPLGGAEGFHPWAIPVPPGRTLRLAGDVALDETLRVTAADTLVIAPGTTLRLAPEVSVLARGPVHAVGTAEAPISFVASGELPWGALALQGPATAGSRLSFVRFRDGGGAQDGRISYKGMVTLHHTRDVRFSDVVFEDNRRSDDALNAVHAEVEIRRCVFRRANGDAIDFDYSTGLIEGCTIEESRNDAIDLMTSSPVIRSNSLLRNGDKGISVGEASTPVIVANVIADGTRGIEIKDRSRPVILHDVIRGNEIGILSNVKNWRYAGGGRGALLLSRVAGNGQDLVFDAESWLTVRSSQIGGEPVEAEAPGAEPRWIRAAHGLDPATPPRPGPPGSEARWIDPLQPVWEDDFGDGEVAFYEAAGGWRTEGSLRLRRRDGVLSAWIERGEAAWETDVSWDLDAPGELVLELTGRDLARLTLVAEGEGGRSEHELRVSSAPHDVDLVTLAIPAGRYRTLRFEGAAIEGAVRTDSMTGLIERRGGRVDVRRIRLFEPGGETSGAP